MESLLNFCLLLLALAALSAWLFQGARRQRSGLGLVALLCVLVLMFPVISATDDLHPATQAFEDASKHTQKGWIAIKSLATPIKRGSVRASIVLALPVFEPTIEWLTQPASTSNSQYGFRFPLFERPPPARLC